MTINQTKQKANIPTVLAHLKDTIFEGLPVEDQAEWPNLFLNAIKVGADLSKVWSQFAVWLLTDPTDGVLQYAKTEEKKLAIQNVADLYKTGGTVEQFKDAYDAAYDAADDAADDAYAAAYVGYAAANAAYAAYAAATGYAAYAASDAAYAAAANAAGAYAANAAVYAAANDAGAYAANADKTIQKHYQAQAKKLLELLASA